MSFVFMVLHWPREEHRQSLAESMLGMRQAMLARPGCLAVEPPYLTEDGGCLVGWSRWASREAFESSGITLGPEDRVFDGELRPRQRFLLEEAVPAGERPGG